MFGRKTKKGIAKASEKSKQVAEEKARDLRTKLANIGIENCRVEVIAFYDAVILDKDGQKIDLSEAIIKKHQK